MSRPELLNEKEIEDQLVDFPLWNRDGALIIKEVVCSNFASVVGLVNSIAFLAEKFDHHPDLLIYGWNKLRITLSTHVRGGLTELDFKLAKQIDYLKI